MSILTDVLYRDIVRTKFNRFQRAYNFEVMLPIVGGVPGELVAPLVQSFSYGEYAMGEPQSMRSGAYQAFFVNDLSIPQFRITFLETEEGLVHQYFKQWRSVMIDRRGLWGNKLTDTQQGLLGALWSDITAGGYAKTVILSYYTSNGLPLRAVKFLRAFPLEVYKADLSYEYNTVQKVEVTFVCDLIEEGITGVSEILGAGESVLGSMISGSPQGGPTVSYTNTLDVGKTNSGVGSLFSSFSKPSVQAPNVKPTPTPTPTPVPLPGRQPVPTPQLSGNRELGYSITSANTTAPRSAITLSPGTSGKSPASLAAEIGKSNLGSMNTNLLAGAKPLPAPPVFNMPVAMF